MDSIIKYESQNKVNVALAETDSGKNLNRVTFMMNTPEETTKFHIEGNKKKQGPQEEVRDRFAAAFKEWAGDRTFGADDAGGVALTVIALPKKDPPSRGDETVYRLDPPQRKGNMILFSFITMNKIKHEGQEMCDCAFKAGYKAVVFLTNKKKWAGKASTMNAIEESVISYFEDTFEVIAGTSKNIDRYFVESPDHPEDDADVAAAGITKMSQAEYAANEWE
jgi:hypothetical protein